VTGQDLGVVPRHPTGLDDGERAGGVEGLPDGPDVDPRHLRHQFPAQGLVQLPEHVVDPVVVVALLVAPTVGNLPPCFDQRQGEVEVDVDVHTGRRELGRVDAPVVTALEQRPPRPRNRAAGHPALHGLEVAVGERHIEGLEEGLVEEIRPIRRLFHLLQDQARDLEIQVVEVAEPVLPTVPDGGADPLQPFDGLPDRANRPAYLIRRESHGCGE
jgi:hypothetical protein